MSDLEQRIKEAAAKYEREEDDCEPLFHAADILVLLAEKDAEIERLRAINRELVNTHNGLVIENSRLRQGERERDEWKRIAGQYREQDRSESDCDEHVDHQDCDERCDICKAYDALVKGE